MAAILVGIVAGAVSSVTGAAIYQARGWQAGLVTKLLVGSAALLGCLLAVSMIATPAAAIGPGAGAITWAESAQVSGGVLLLVAGFIIGWNFGVKTVFCVCVISLGLNFWQSVLPEGDFLHLERILSVILGGILLIRLG